jgi:hypothetical protein
MKVFRCFPPLAVGLLAFALLHDAQAQMGGMGGGMGGMGRGRGGGEGSRGQESRAKAPLATPDPDSFEQVDYRLSLLEDALKLKDDQLAPWRAFQAKTRDYAQDVVRERGREAMSVSATQMRGLPHIGQAVDAARNRLAALEDVEGAARVLYAVLSPAQQAVADVGIPAIVAPRRPQAGVQVPAAGARGRSPLVEPGGDAKPAP